MTTTSLRWTLAASLLTLALGAPAALATSAATGCGTAAPEQRVDDLTVTILRAGPLHRGTKAPVTAQVTRRGTNAAIEDAEVDVTLTIRGRAVNAWHNTNGEGVAHAHLRLPANLPTGMAQLTATASHFVAGDGHCLPSVHETGSASPTSVRVS